MKLNELSHNVTHNATFLQRIKQALFKVIFKNDERFNKALKED
jgi:hypothetical protein